MVISRLEAIAGCAVLHTPPVCERPLRSYLVHQVLTAFAVRGEVLRFEAERRIVLRAKLLGHALEDRMVAHHRGVAFDHQIETFGKRVTTCGDGAMRILREVISFAFGIARD